ncbi:MAG: hypothetical protein WAM70_09280, partial [Pyrinomonadaceae bacterium]
MAKPPSLVDQESTSLSPKRTGERIWLRLGVIWVLVGIASLIYVGGTGKSLIELESGDPRPTFTAIMSVVTII